jgi:beta-lactamase class A
VAQSGLAPAFPGAAAFGRATGPERLRLASALDEQARKYRADDLQRRLDQYFDGHYDPATDLGTQNVSSPAEFGALVASEFLRPGLSPASRAVQRQVMATGFGRSRLRLPTGAGVAEFGGKGGNGWRLLTFSGYVHTRDGRDLVYVFMQHGADQTYTMPGNRLAFKWINAALSELLSPGGTVHLATRSAASNQKLNLNDAGPSTPP